MRLTNNAEVWQKAYEAFQQVNFSAWDYNTIKQSLVDYIKINFPEDYNDLIESAELIMILEIFAYVGELIAYRLDLNATENFLSTAQRKESVLRLAKLISYTASRNIPARGLVKITSLSTTETIFDSRGLNLSNKTILWNDRNNSNWKEQFILILNRIFQQNFGSVLPSDRIQVQDVLFELYGLNNEPLSSEVLKYNISVSGKQYPMELVSATLNDSGPIEKRPQKNQAFNILYLNDGLGDASDNTGFFSYTKQGELQKITTFFDGITPNQTYDISINNINDTDVWVNNVDENGVIVVNASITSDFREGEWDAVDVSNSKNILFNTDQNRNKYEVETLDNDNIRLLFGDNLFSAIPSGIFDIWVRTSANEDLVIPTNAIQNNSSSIIYRDADSKEQTLTFTFTLNTTIQNASIAESMEHIKQIAPSINSTQGRMVNGQDYNEYMLQDNSILKLRAVNRTFAGDSKYIAWHDPQEYYENVQMYGTDLVVYFKTIEGNLIVPSAKLPQPDVVTHNSSLISALINNHIQPLLVNPDLFMKQLLAGVKPLNIRKEFRDFVDPVTQVPNILEITNLQNDLNTAIISTPHTVYMRYDATVDRWYSSTTNPGDEIWWFNIVAESDGDWTINYRGNRIISHSENITFWGNNNAKTIIDYDTFNNSTDTLMILKANIGSTNAILTKNYPLFVIGQEMIETGVDAGTYSSKDLLVVAKDENNDTLPDDSTLSFLISNTSFVYFIREQLDSGGFSDWEYRPTTPDVIQAYTDDLMEDVHLWKRENGVEGINFLWLHYPPRYHLVDPAASNLVDIYLITRGYYTTLRLWLTNQLQDVPKLPTPYQLRNDYNYLIDSKMISDTVILHPGKIKIIIGDKAIQELRATFKVIKSPNSTMTNNQLKTSIVDLIIEFFDINIWKFGETFYFTELSAYIHSMLPVDVDSVVLVPVYSRNIFGDLFEITAAVDEIIQPSISVNDIEIVDSINPRTLRKIL